MRAHHDEVRVLIGGIAQYGGGSGQIPSHLGLKRYVGIAIRQRSAVGVREQALPNLILGRPPSLSLFSAEGVLVKHVGVHEVQDRPGMLCQTDGIPRCLIRNRRKVAREHDVIQLKHIGGGVVK